MRFGVCGDAQEGVREFSCTEFVISFPRRLRNRDHHASVVGLNSDGDVKRRNLEFFAIELMLHSNGTRYYRQDIVGQYGHPKGEEAPMYTNWLVLRPKSLWLRVQRLHRP